MRHHRARCIKTFGPPAGSGSESAVQNLLVSPSGDTLYSASGNFINIWDLKKWVSYLESGWGITCMARNAL